MTCSDSDGYIYDPDGIDEKKLAYIMELKNIERGRIKEYVEEYPTAKYVPGAKPWGEKADIATPCATQNEIDGEAAKTLVANGVIAVSEGANMPSTPEAVKVFQDNKILYCPQGQQRRWCGSLWFGDDAELRATEVEPRGS